MGGKIHSPCSVQNYIPRSIWSSYEASAVCVSQIKVSWIGIFQRQPNSLIMFGRTVHSCWGEAEADCDRGTIIQWGNHSDFWSLVLDSRKLLNVHTMTGFCPPSLTFNHVKRVSWWPVWTGGMQGSQPVTCFVVHMSTWLLKKFEPILYHHFTKIYSLSLSHNLVKSEDTDMIHTYIGSVWPPLKTIKLNLNIIIFIIMSNANKCPWIS